MWSSGVLCIALLSQHVHSFILPKPLLVTTHHRQTTQRLWSQASSLTSTQESQVLDALRVIVDPDLGQDIVTLGFIKDLEIDATNGGVSFSVELTTPACPVKEQFKTQCKEAVEALPWVEVADVTMTAQPMRESKQGPSGLSRVQNIIAVSSCKGGVGKSTTSVNLAFALQASGARVGILDADIYGPSLPTMVKPDRDVVEFAGNEICPMVSKGVKLMSYGYVNEGAAIMRGPMVVQLLQQFVSLTSWGDLDYLLIDMPPGTGDVQLTLCQSLNITAAVIVTTPQRLSFTDVVKGIDMFDAVNVPSIAVVENMAYYEETDTSALGAAAKRLADAAVANGTPLTPEVVASIAESAADEACVQRSIFGRGHSKRLADMWGIKSVMRMPLDAEVSMAGDSGVPLFVSNPDGRHAALYRQLADDVVREVAKLQHGSARRPSLDYDEANRLITVNGGEGPAITMEPAELRKICRCAVCVEEMTGRPLLDPNSIPSTIAPLNFYPIGNYAVSVDWSDGHKSLYPYTSFVEGFTGRKRRLPSMSEKELDPAVVA